MLYAEEGAGLAFTGGSAAVSTLITFLLGLGIVFIGLVALIVIIKLMSAIMKGVTKPKAVKEAAVPEAPAAAAVPEGDRGEIIAAVSAAIATVMGESVGGIRIVSFKKVD